MHEYSLVQALLERVEAEAEERGACRVRRIAVRIGDLAGVERDLFATAFAMFTAGSRSEGAFLEILPVAADWQCPRCEQSIEQGRILRCPTCGAPAVLAAGGDLILDRIELEVTDV